MQFHSLLLGSILGGDILGTNFDRNELGCILFVQFDDNFGYFRQNNVFNQTKNCPKWVMPYIFRLFKP